MSGKNITKNHRILEESIEEIITYGLEIISSNFEKSKLFGEKEKITIIEGLLLRACAIWEKFIETEIIYLVNMDKSYLLNELELPQNSVLNLKMIKAILFANSYRDFHDIERSKNFFRTFISDKYNLFDEITSDQIRKIKIVYKLRNYLAHYSEFSKKKLHKEYIKIYNYSNFMEPGRFLIKNNGEYFENLIHNFCLVSATMEKKIK